MPLDGKRVERVRGLPCRDNIGEFATLEGRLENDSKEITFINYNNNESGTSVTNEVKQAKKKKREI